MKMIKFLLIVCEFSAGAAVFSGCGMRNDRSVYEKLQGHWHSKDPYWMTLDIKDSLVELDKHSFFRNPYKFELFDSVDKVPSLPIPCGCGSAILPVVRDFTLTTDSLIYVDSLVAKGCSAYMPVRFAKSDLEKCKWTHSMEEWTSLIRLSRLPKATGPVVKFDSLRTVTPVATMAIGYPSIPDQFGAHPVILVYDVFITPTDISLFLRMERQKYDQTYPLLICLAIDESVPKEFVEEVMEAIPNEYKDKLYKMVLSESQVRIGCESMNAI